MTVTSQELQKQTHNTKSCQFKQNIITMMMTAFEKDLFVAVISEENDTGKETIGNLHNIVIHLYEQAFEILGSQYGKDKYESKN